MQNIEKCRGVIEPWGNESQGDTGEVHRVVLRCGDCQIGIALSAPAKALLGALAKDFKRSAPTFCGKLEGLEEESITDSMLPVGLSPVGKSRERAEATVLPFRRRSNTKST